MFSARDPSDLERFFRGLTEYAFYGRLGIVDPPLVEYLTTLLVRFIHHDHLRALPGAEPVACDDVSHMLSIAQHEPPDVARGEYRHIGDYTLFWSGVYPEALQRFQRPSQPDHLLDYREAGRQAYRLAAALEPEEAVETRHVLVLLSEEYDSCVVGLGEVRRAWGEAA
jgi:hypothetical protein